MAATIERSDQPAETRRVPDFFVVGHAKSGTSALDAMLRQHPEIFLSVREPSFFVPEVRVLKNQPKHPDTLEGYLALFEAAKPEQRMGDITPSYLWSQTAAARIAEVQPDARIIAILREPASYLRSFHLEFLRQGIETEKDLRKALELEPKRREGKAIPRNSPRPQWLQYSEQVRYVEQLRRYEDAFSREQMLILIYDDYRADNQATIRRVFRFLGVDESASFEVVDANPSTRIRSPALLATVRSLALGRSGASRALKPAIKALSTSGMRRRAIALQNRGQRGRPSPPDEDLMRELRRRYKSEVVALSEYLDRDLVSFWNYDDVG
ncbi:MAG: sulfotransferase family protein [Solirubrobacteraceae bacterium]